MAGVIVISEACSVLLLNFVSGLLLPSLSPFFNSENFYFTCYDNKYNNIIT